MDDQAVFTYELIYNSASAVTSSRVPEFGVTVRVSSDDRYPFLGEDMFQLLEIASCRLAVLKISRDQNDVFVIARSV